MSFLDNCKDCIMSTFNGYVHEFPYIRIDFFRTLQKAPPPLAAFLSHVHSDHLCGLESFRSTFIYCSAATRSLLLRLEKHPHRINYAKGILEARVQTYKHLDKVLRPIPLETPTKIELCPGREIQATLFEANHCVGAVSFLIQGDGKAVFYTGDVRAERWWVDALVRQPTMLPFTRGLRRLDRLYLDTTFATKKERYQEFPSKADGIAELLKSLAGYSDDTVFYFHSWTFGYEDVFLVLSQALNSPIHLDRYRYSLYTSIGGTVKNGSSQQSREAPIFSGFQLGNTAYPGIFTSDHTKARIHSCEKGTDCPVFHDIANVVDITPIVSRFRGEDMQEMGIGGGKGDLDQVHELELADAEEVLKLISLVKTKTDDRETLLSLNQVLEAARSGVRQRVQLDLPSAIATHLETAQITVQQLTDILASNNVPKAPAAQPHKPSNSITFPYSRHSSHSELAHLVATLEPLDIYPCTAPTVQSWTEDTSMESLFGHVCPDGIFAWDVTMRALKARHDNEEGSQQETSNPPHETQRSDVTESEAESEGQEHRGEIHEEHCKPDGVAEDAAERRETPATEAQQHGQTTDDSCQRRSRDLSIITIDSESEPDEVRNTPINGRHITLPQTRNGAMEPITPPKSCAFAKRKQTRSPIGVERSRERLRARQEAFRAAAQGRWASVRLASTWRVADGDEEL